MINKDTWLEYTIWHLDTIGHISLCGLCGNTGMIGGGSGKGLNFEAMGRAIYMSPRPCICPNGRISIRRKRFAKPDIAAINTPPKDK